MTRPALVVALALACGLGPADRALAQQVSPELVSLLARAALPREDTVAVVESALPPEWAGRLPVPAGTRFVGAVVGRSAAIAYFASAASPAASQGLARAAAQAAGFAVAPEPPLVPGAFVTQRPAPANRPLCRGATEQLTIEARPQAMGTLVTVAYAAGPSYVCAPPRAPGRQDPFDLLPKLQPPPLPAGAAFLSCARSGSDATTGMELVSALDLPGVLRFYGSQLEAAGWQRAPADSSAAGTWLKVTGADSARVTLAVNGPTGTAAGCRRVQLELRRNYAPR